MKDPSPLPELLLFLLLFSYASTAAAQAPGAFAPTGNMTTARSGHTATLLNNGRVLIAGGWQGLASAELYDPVTGTFTATSNMTTGRSGHAAVLLPDGRVLIAGGVGGASVPGGFGAYLASAELYDPSTGTFTPAGDMVTATSGPTAKALSKSDSDEAKHEGVAVTSTGALR